MNYNYDDVERILNIYSTTDSFLNAEQMLNNLNNMKTPLGQEFYAALVKKVYPIYDMGYLVYVNQSSSHGYNSFLYLLKNNGEYIDLNNIFKQYNFITEWGKLNVSGEEDGLFLYLKTILPYYFQKMLMPISMTKVKKLINIAWI